METLYCAACVYAVQTYRGQKDFFLLHKHNMPVPEPVTVHSIEHACELTAWDFLQDDCHVNYGIYAETFVDGTALCYSHSVLAMMRKESKPRKRLAK